jgi:hypothetical protein
VQVSGLRFAQPRARRELRELIEAVGRDHGVAGRAILGGARGEPVATARIAALCVVRTLYPEMQQSLLARLFGRSEQWVSQTLAETIGRRA